jgi:D-serine deaminase-like pyridoxal phosphate-dependent protein
MSTSLHVSDLETPALIIDLDVLERNLARLADYGRERHLRLRPHTKTHKIPALARKQLDLGAAGLTVAKVGEAEVMLGAEPPDLLVAFPVIGRGKLDRLMEVSRHTKVTVSLDSLCAARQLSDAAQTAHLEIGVLAEADVGLGRVGVAPGTDLVDLARGIERLPGLRFEGIAFYPGHIKVLDEDGLRALDQLSETVESMLEDLRRAGFTATIVSGGSTPTLFQSHHIRGLNEIRPGTYIFNDRNTVQCGAANMEDCAASIVATVVSTAHPGQIIIDGGSKTFSSDRQATGEVSFGHVLDAPQAVFGKMNEEHGFIDVQSAERAFSVGDRVRIIPNHICVAMNLHEQVYGVRADRVECMWRVEGRGKLQ